MDQNEWEGESDLNEEEESGDELNQEAIENYMKQVFQFQYKTVQGEDEEDYIGYPSFDSHRSVWTKIPLKHSKHGIGGFKPLRFNHFIVIRTFVGQDDEEGKGSKTVFLVVDMRDDSVQEIEIHEESWQVGEYCESDYSLTKYNENQIIKFGEGKGGKMTLSLVTIESFQPLQLKFEDIAAENTPSVGTHTAQIHNDFLYVYGDVQEKERERCLWRFDIKNRVWELLNLAGKAPEYSYEPMSFVFQDHFYYFGGGEYADGKLYVLNLGETMMTWKKFGHKIDMGETRVNNQCLYKGHVMTLVEYEVEKYYEYKLDYYESRKQSSNQTVGWWKINPNATKKDDERCQVRRSKKISLDYELNGIPVMYDNYMLNFGTREIEEGGYEFCMFALDLQFTGLPFPKSQEDERIGALFLKEENSDITFKVQDQRIPAHKEVLIKKSKYFAQKLGNESVIEITDCDESTFKEFLKHLYCEGIHAEEGIPRDVTLKLIAFADKCQQYDLRDECVEILKFNLNSKNVLGALDLAEQIKLPRLKNSCIDFLKTKIDVNNVSMLIKFLESQKEDSKDLEVTAKAISFVLKNFEKISKKDAENLGLYENFLVKNFGIDTITLFAEAAYSKKANNYSGGKWVSELSGDGTTDLRLVLVNFGEKNLKEIKTKEIFKNLPKMFLVDLVSRGLGNQEKQGSN